VDWHTAWNAIEVEAKTRVGQTERLARVKTLGVDEHIWRPSKVGTDRAVTIMVDLTRDQMDACTRGCSTPSSAARHRLQDLAESPA
jgi:hypothetical protein